MDTTTVQTVTFGGDGNARIFQISGWSDPETGFTWSVGARCEMVLPALDAPDGFLIELTCAIFRPLDLEVRVNEATVASCVIDTSGVFVWQAPPTQGPVPIQLTFLHPNAQRPCDLIELNDSRPLGLQCHRLRLLRLEPSDALPAATADVPPDAELAMAFAPLGHDSELSHIQRALGAEPPGLFRFCETHLPFVLRGIETGWEGLADHLDAAVEAGAWMTRDHRYGLRWNTFFGPDDIDRETLLSKERQKIDLLRRQLIEEIANAARIFVVKSPDGPDSAELITALHVALNRGAPNWLLWVTADGEPGSLEMIGPRLMRGHVSRFMRPGYGSDYVLYDWTAIMRTGWRLAWGGARALPPAAADVTTGMLLTASNQLAHTAAAGLAIDPETDERSLDGQTFPTLESLERIYQDEPSVHRRIYDACETAMAQDSRLRSHREHVEQNQLGFGDRAFHWLWKLIVDAMPAHFKFLEIGVYKGQVTSLLGMLAITAGKTVENFGVTPLGTFGDKFSNYEDVDYLAAIRSIESWCGIPRERRARIIRGFSNDDEIKAECQGFAPFDLIYIDGCHDYDVVVSDIVSYGNLLRPGGLLVMDDASTELRLPPGIWPGHTDVGRAVREVLEPMRIFTRVTSVGHLRVWRKTASDEQTSPDASGTDQRAVSGHGERPNAGPELPVCDADADILFGVGGNDGPYLKSGWSEEKGGFRWSTDRTSCFVMAAARDADFFILELECHPCDRPGLPPAQQLILRVHGQLAGSTEINQLAVVAFSFRRPDGAGDVFEFTLEFPNAEFPDDTGASEDRRLMAIAMIRARLFSVKSPVPVAPLVSCLRLPDGVPTEQHAAEVLRVSGMSIVELLGRFESIGQDCEFGLFQRMCDAEPIGLFRFAYIELRNMIRGLDANFEDIDDPALISAVLDRPEVVFNIHHEKYRFAYHTDSYAKDTTAELVATRHAKLLTLRRRVFLERIANAERIFVLKRNQPVNDAEALAVFRALRRHGPATLLHVVPADATHTAGCVELVMQGLLKGYIDTVWYDGLESISIRHWLEICLNAHALSMRTLAT